MLKKKLTTRKYMKHSQWKGKNYWRKWIHHSQWKGK